MLGDDITVGNKIWFLVQERAVVCRSPLGLPILGENCDQEDLSKSEAFQDCSAELAQDQCLQLGPWSECSKTCAEFNETTGTQKRSHPLQ